MPNAEIFSGYEIWVPTHQQQKKCINSLKKTVKYTKSTDLKVVSIYSLRIAKLLGLALRMRIYQFSL